MNAGGLGSPLTAPGATMNNVRQTARTDADTALSIAIARAAAKIDLIDEIEAECAVMAANEQAADNADGTMDSASR